MRVVQMEDLKKKKNERERKHTKGIYKTLRI